MLQTDEKFYLIMQIWRWNSIWATYFSRIYILLTGWDTVRL